MSKYWILWKVDEKQNYTLERESLPTLPASPSQLGSNNNGVTKTSNNSGFLHSFLDQNQSTGSRVNALVSQSRVKWDKVWGGFWR